MDIIRLFIYFTDALGISSFNARAVLDSITKSKWNNLETTSSNRRACNKQKYVCVCVFFFSFFFCFLFHSLDAFQITQFALFWWQPRGDITETALFARQVRTTKTH